MSECIVHVPSIRNTCDVYTGKGLQRESLFITVMRLTANTPFTLTPYRTVRLLLPYLPAHHLHNELAQPDQNSHSF